MQITVQSKTISGWHNTATAVELRIVSSTAFVSSDGTLIQGSPFYQSVTCTPDLTAHTLTIPSFTIWSTLDALDITTALYTFTFYCGPVTAEPIVNLSFGNKLSIFIPVSPTTTTLDQIEVANAAVPSTQFDVDSVINQSISAWYAGVPFPDGETRPSIAGKQSFYTQNTVDTDIVDFVGPYNQKVIWVFIGDSHTSIFGSPRNIGAFLQFGWGVDDEWHEMTSGALGIQTINALTALDQLLATGTAGTDFAISSSVATHTFNLPDAGAAARGVINTTAQTIAGAKTIKASSSLGALNVQPTGSVNNSLSVRNTAASVNGVAVIAGETGDNAELVAIGSDTNVTLELKPKGTGAVEITAGVSLNKHYTFDSDGFSTQQPIILEGATSGQTQLVVPSVAGDFKVILPSNIPDIGDTLTVLAITPGTPNIIELDYEAGGGGSSAAVYDLAAQAFGLLASNQVVLSFVACRTFTLGITGSAGYCGTVPTADADFIVRYSSDNGASWTTKATLQFAAASHISTIVSSVSTTIASGDLVQVLAPSSTDTTLADVTLTIKSRAADATSYDLSGQANGGLANNQVIFTFVADRSFTLSLTGSTGSSGTAATAQTDFLIRYSDDNGSSWTNKGTLRFAAAAKVTTLVGAASTSVSSGDLVQLIGPATADTALADVTFSLVGSV